MPTFFLRYAQQCISRCGMWLTLLRIGYPYRRAWVMAGEIAEELRGAA